MTIPPWLTKLAEYFDQANQQLYLVGGALRNDILHLPIEEWDCATSAKPKEIERLLREFGCGQIGTVGKRFGTITAVFQGETVEVTTFRSEEYHEFSRQPEVSFGNSIREDLSRRDFTINAMAYNLKTQELIDPYHGQQDCRAKVIHSVGEANERFAEDPLRILRAIRFMVQLDFTIDPNVINAIKTERSRLAILSAERINAELNKMLLSTQPSRAIKLMVETEVINYILPELLPSIDLEFDRREHKDIYHHILQVLDNTPPKLELRWCALLHDIAKPQTRRKIGGEYHFLGHEVVGARTATQVLQRLKYSNDFIKYVSKLVRLHQRIPNDDGKWTDGAIRRFVRDAGTALNDLFAFAQADSTGTNTAKQARYAMSRQRLQARIKDLEAEAEIAKIRPPLDGQELMELFHRPAGPWIKPIKEKLLAMVLDGELSASDKETARTIAKKHLEQK